MPAHPPTSPAPLSVALALGARTYPRLGMRRGVERYVREHQPAWRLIQKGGHTHLDWPDAASGSPDGVIAFFENGEHFSWVREQALPAVNMNRVPGFGGMVCEVLVDDADVGQRAALYFLEKGFRRFVYCTHVPQKGFSQDRYESFRDTLRGSGLDTAFLSLQDPPEETAQALRELVKSAGDERIAVFCCDDACGGMLSARCRSLSIRIPGQLVILGAGDDAFHVENDTVTLSSVKIDFPAVGYHAAAMMDSLLQGKPASFTPLRVTSAGITERMSTSGDADSPTLRRLLRLIDDRHTDPEFSPVTAARICNVSSRTLRRYLKEADRPPFSDLLRDRRLETAMNRLVSTEDPVERVCEQAGFLDYTTFFRAFRRRYGMSPTDCRRGIDTPAPYDSGKIIAASRGLHRAAGL